MNPNSGKINFSSVLLNLRSYGIAALLFGLAFFGSSYLFPEEQGNLLDPLSTLTIMIVGFLLAIMLKVDYTKKLFLVILIAALFLASIFTFTQAILTVILVLFFLKLLRII